MYSVISLNCWRREVASLFNFLQVIIIRFIVSGIQNKFARKRTEYAAPTRRSLDYKQR